MAAVRSLAKLEDAGQTSFDFASARKQRTGRRRDLWRRDEQDRLKDICFKVVKGYFPYDPESAHDATAIALGRIADAFTEGKIEGKIDHFARKVAKNEAIRLYNKKRAREAVEDSALPLIDEEKQVVAPISEPTSLSPVHLAMEKVQEDLCVEDFMTILSTASSEAIASGDVFKEIAKGTGMSKELVEMLVKWMQRRLQKELRAMV